MEQHNQPSPISPAKRRARNRRIRQIARRLQFNGRIEYRHVYSQSGGAQYCIGPAITKDILVVYAEAFERDADPEDFSLDALIAHECGHQQLHRNTTLRTILRSIAELVTTCTYRAR